MDILQRNTNLYLIQEFNKRYNDLINSARVLDSVIKEFAELNVKPMELGLSSSVKKDFILYEYV